jgi:hypothetical protein
MKNLHLIPTNKPSRLHFDGKLFLSPNYQDSKTINSIVEGKHIYITSNEEIKEGDKSLLFVDGFEPMILTHFKPVEEGYKGKKIILTTDVDLIEDGVQAINDKFLEWFVKNPSCEEVEVIPLRKSSGHYDDKDVWHWDFLAYKIILPNEEPNPFELPKTEIN